MQEGFIYESPDGGKTIYGRKVNDTNRELHRKDEDEPVQVNVVDNLYSEIIKIRTSLFRLERKIDKQSDITARQQYLDCENRDIYDVLDEFQTSIIERINKLERDIGVYKSSQELSAQRRQRAQSGQTVLNQETDY